MTSNQELYESLNDDLKESASARPADEFATPEHLKMTTDRERKLLDCGFKRNRYEFRQACGVLVMPGRGWVRKRRDGWDYYTDCMALAELRRLETRVVEAKP